MRRGIALVLGLLAAACDPGAGLLVVSLRTDLVAGAEVDELVLTVDGAERARRAIAPGEALLDGVAVAEVEGLALGPHRVELALLRAGDPVAAQPTAVSVAEATAVTVVVTRDCRGVDCGAGDAARACLGAVCVEPSCTPETPDACPPPACDADADCGPGDACSVARCADGVCLYADAGRCDPDSYCDPDFGCRALTRPPLEILVSQAADRGGPRPLEGATLAGAVYVFAEDAPGLAAADYRIDQVEDWQPLREATEAPFDLVGDSTPAAAAPLETGFLPGGEHVMRVTARWDDGRVDDFELRFATTGALDGWYTTADGFRASPEPLVDGARIAGDVFLLWAPGERRDILRVFFYFDDPDRLGMETRLENTAPFDVGGTTRTAPFDSALPVDAGAPGMHTWTVRVETVTGGEDVQTLSYEVP